MSFSIKSVAYWCRYYFWSFREMWYIWSILGTIKIHFLSLTSSMVLQHRRLHFLIPGSKNFQHLEYELLIDELLLSVNREEKCWLHVLWCWASTLNVHIMCYLCLCSVCQITNCYPQIRLFAMGAFLLDSSRCIRWNWDLSYSWRRDFHCSNI